MIIQSAGICGKDFRGGVGWGVGGWGFEVRKVVVVKFEIPRQGSSDADAAKSCNFKGGGGGI